MSAEEEDEVVVNTSANSVNGDDRSDNGDHSDNVEQRLDFIFDFLEAEGKDNLRGKAKFLIFTRPGPGPQLLEEVV